MKRQRAKLPPPESAKEQLPMRRGGLVTSFLIPMSISFPRRHAIRNRRQCVCVGDASSLACYPFLEMFKGVVIGPTINEVAAALAGGTVGVMGTIIALEAGRQKAKERKQCPYCRGTGKLPCGNCHALGAVPSGNAVGAQEPCDLCHSGFLNCNHCEGEGRLIPIEYERAIHAQYEDYVVDSRNDDYYNF